MEEMPEPETFYDWLKTQSFDLYTPEAVGLRAWQDARSFGNARVREAVEKERERCALLCLEVGEDVIEGGIRKGALMPDDQVAKNVRAITNVCASEIRDPTQQPDTAAIRKPPAA